MSIQQWDDRRAVLSAFHSSTTAPQTPLVHLLGGRPLPSPQQFPFTTEPLSRILVGAQDFFSLCIHFIVTKQMAKNLVVHGLLLVPQMRLSGPQFSCESIFLNENVCEFQIPGFFWKPGKSNTLDSHGSSDLH